MLQYFESIVIEQRFDILCSNRMSNKNVVHIKTFVQNISVRQIVCWIRMITESTQYGLYIYILFYLEIIGFIAVFQTRKNIIQ